jgi:hypothetical protein
LAGIVLAAWAQVSPAKEDPKERLMFAERCKKAGVFIHRAEDVEGVFS